MPSADLHFLRFLRFLRDRFCLFCIVCTFCEPQMPLHIHMPVSLKANALFLQQCPLPTPPRSRSSLFIHHPMTRQRLSPRCIPQRPPHHPRMTGPTCQSRDIPVCCHSTTRYLTDDVQHILAKCPRLLHRHPIGIVLHLAPFNVQ